MKQTLLAWAQLFRISNLPTVWTNVLLGVTAAGGPHQGRWELSAFALAAGSLLYAALMVDHDLCDAQRDATERPNRPIPAGRIATRNAYVVAVAIISLSILCILQNPNPGFACWLGILGFGVLYNQTHHKTAWSILFPPLCRVGVIGVGAYTAVGINQTEWPPNAGLVAGSACSLAVYLLIVSCLARKEHKPDSKFKPTHIGWLLSGICLHDAIWLLLLGAPGLAGVAVGCFVLCRVLAKVASPS
ncbi:MAG: UbiA family prenyltransferase [Planctomycetota bacterium]